MKNTLKKYKILLLSDLKNSSATALKSTISLAKMIDADIEFFHAKKPTDVVENENQLSAMRTINEDQNTTQKTIQDLVVPLAKDYAVKINYKFAVGNIKNEIKKRIDTLRPDIVVVGKRKPKILNLIGDNITDFVLKKHDGVVMIAANKNAIEPNKEISLGVLNSLKQSFNLDFAEQLLDNSQQPLRSFKIMNSKNDSEQIEKVVNKNIVEYVFEEGDNTISNISNYLSKKDVNLFCMDRGKKNSNKSVIDKLDVSFLVTR